jgi:hypothetical protein
MLGDVGGIVYFCGEFYNKAKTKNYEKIVIDGLCRGLTDGM